MSYAILILIYILGSYPAFYVLYKYMCWLMGPPRDTTFVKESFYFSPVTIVLISIFAFLFTCASLVGLAGDKFGTTFSMIEQYVDYLFDERTA